MALTISAENTRRLKMLGLKDFTHHFQAFSLPEGRVCPRRPSVSDASFSTLTLDTTPG